METYPSINEKHTNTLFAIFIHETVETIGPNITALCHVVVQ